VQAATGTEKAARPLLPAELVSRRKMGFGVRVGEWMRCELRPMLEDVLLAAGSPVHRYIQTPALGDLVRSHVAGRGDCSDQLWSLLCLGLWHREFNL